MRTCPLLWYYTAHLFYLLALVVKPSPYRRLFMVPITLGIICFFRSPLHFRTHWEHMFTVLVLDLFFTASSQILLIDVQRELFLKGQTQPIHQRPLLERIKWALKLALSVRGIGWTNEPRKCLPPRHPDAITHSRFFIQQVFHLACDFAICKAVTAYMKRSPCYSMHECSDGVLWLATDTIACLIWFFTCLDGPHRMIGILFVVSGISDAPDWVPLFGSITDAYSLQNFWGRVWHQIIRRHTVAHGRFLAQDVLHLKKKSRVSQLAMLYVAFAISGLMHLAGEYAILGRWTFSHAFRFFILQAFGITVEMIATETAGRLSLHESWYQFAIGYLWVLGWLMYTGRYWVIPLIRAGMADAPLDSGVFDRLLGRR